MEIFLASGSSDEFAFIGSKEGFAVHAGAAVTNSLFSAIKSHPDLPFDAMDVVLEFCEMSEMIGVFRATVYLDEEWAAQQRAKNQARESMWLERDKRR